METNRYAAKVRQQDAHAHARPWSDVTVEEMGMLMLMGISRLPRLEMYWSTKHPLINPGLADVFPKVRFEQIFRFIRLTDSDQQVDVGQPGYDVLFEVH